MFCWKSNPTGSLLPDKWDGWRNCNVLDLNFRNLWVRVSKKTPVVLSKNFRGIPQFLQANSRILSQIRLQNAYLEVISNSWLTNHVIMRWHIGCRVSTHVDLILLHLLTPKPRLQNSCIHVIRRKWLVPIGNKNVINLRVFVVRTNVHISLTSARTKQMAKPVVMGSSTVTMSSQTNEFLMLGKPFTTTESLRDTFRILLWVVSWSCQYLNYTV